MKKIIFISLSGVLLILGGFYFTRPTHYEHQLSICATFKNEAPFLKEWIEYHRLIGATHFYLYNNGSTDHSLEVLEPYVESGLVEVIDWKNSEHHAIHRKNEKTLDPYRIGAYNHCLKTKALKKSQWVAIIDLDEFIVPAHGPQSLPSLLERESRKKTGSLRLNWKIFGTSHVWELKPGELMVEKLILKAQDNHPWNAHVKSIHRPEAVRFTLVHEAEKLHKNYERKHLPPNSFCIHHYWTGVEKRMLERRGNYAEIKELSNEFNKCEDTTMLQYVPALKKAFSSE